MRRFPFILTLRATQLIGYALIGCCLVGCGGSSDQIVDDVVQKDGSKPVAPKMSEIGDFLPPLDNGRVKIAPPKGWHILPRKSKYLVSFTRKKGVSYPAIIVTVKPFEEIDEVTTENIKEYADLLDGPGDNQELRRVDRFVAVSYTKQGTLKDGVRTTLLDRKFLDTVVDHRRYQFELRTKEGALEQFMPDLLAVAVKTQFLKRKNVEELEDLDAEEAEATSPAEAPAPAVKPAPAKTPKAAAPKTAAPKAATKPKSVEQPTKEAEKKPTKKRPRRRTSEFD